jgi:hypothetical protein
MEQSKELKDFYLRICEAISNGNDSFFENCFSKKDGTLAIGTDPKEWWNGYATITKMFKAQLEQMNGFQILANASSAYCDGPIGWVAGQPIIKLPDGEKIPSRLTAIFQKEQYNWKIVQWHFSIGIPNEDSVGEMPTT